MLETILSLQFTGFYGGSIGNLLAQWEQAGVFSYVLPFLLIFAIIYGILSKTKIFGDENKNLNTVISLVIGLLALQFDFVPLFFSEIFPKVCVGLAIILAMIIVLGLFLPNSATKFNYLLLGAAAIVFFIVVSRSFSNLGYYASNSGIWNIIYANLGSITIIVIVIAAVSAVIGASAPTTQPYSALWQQVPPHK